MKDSNYNMSMKMNDGKEYSFKIKWSDKNNLKAVELSDGTYIWVKDGKLGLSFPKEKFFEIFDKQMKDEKVKSLSLQFNPIELVALSQGFTKLHELKSKNI